MQPFNNLSFLLSLYCFSSILPLSSTSTSRRILHQPIFNTDTPPPPSPPIPDYPFSGSTPPPTPFFPNYPSPPSSLTSFPANLPRAPKPKSVSTKLIATAVASVLAALIVLLLAVFLHLNKRRTRSTSSDTKTTGSDTSTRCYYNHNPTTLPKLTRPSQTSSEFLYLGTLVNAHVGLNPTQQNDHTNTGTSALNLRKMDSPELRPLPPLNIQKQNSGTQESDEFYSPRGSGRESSIAAGSASRRTFASLDVANLNRLSSSTSSSDSGSGSASSSVSASPPSISPSISVSPKRPISMMPKSPQLEAVQLHAPPRISNVSDHNDVESPVEMCNSVQKNVLVFNPFFRFSSALDQNVGSPERASDHVRRNEDGDSDLGISYLFYQNGDSSGTMKHDDEHVLEPNSQTSAVSCQNMDSSNRVTGVAVKDDLDSYESFSHVSDQDVGSPERVTNPVTEAGDVSEQYSSSSNVTGHGVESPVREETPILVTSVQLPPPISIPPPPLPPPPPPPKKSWDSPNTPSKRKPISESPILVTPLRPMVIESPILISPIQLPTQSDYHEGNEASVERSADLHEADERSEETPKPKLKPLHWDKVRASSDREMVWDQLRSSSFKLNEEMIESLFIVKAPNPTSAETTRRQILPLPSQENRVLDPKKSQNIAILLKALHVTVDEVCDALLEGNTETLGTDLLESFLKMAPTKEEERKLKEHKDDSPVKLGPAERFLKEVLDIPFAFKRVDAMLYISNFDSEVEYLKKSFETLENACEELRSSRMFLKLLEAVLKTGNRMNVGTNRGDAHAFKLDTLLKLVDVKGTDGKTTLLHFVVQEITRSEGARISASNQYDDVKCRKLGLQVVSSLASDLTSVKKAAAMDSEILNSDVIKLSKGLEKIGEVIKFNESISSEQSCRNKFSETMNGFMKIAEEEIIRIQAQESVTLTLVKEITEYFHGNSAKEEAHPFRIFMVVRDFLSVVERVCKEVGMINERTIVSSAHKFPVPVNPMLQPVSSGFPGRRQYSSSDDESPSS